MLFHWSGSIYVTDMSVRGPKISQYEHTWYFVRLRSTEVKICIGLICGFGNIRSKDMWRPCCRGPSTSKSRISGSAILCQLVHGSSVCARKTFGSVNGNNLHTHTHSYGLYRVRGREIDRQKDSQFSGRKLK
jgi:hypothetical protein